MAKTYPVAYLKDRTLPFREANLSVASSAVLYGLSIYTVFFVSRTKEGFQAFRLPAHFERLVNSSRIVGLDEFEKTWDFARFEKAVKEVVAANAPSESVFARVTVHCDALVPGVRSRGLPVALSLFLYEASPILPPSGARLKTSLWRRTPDYSIPSRAKVNGAYVNSVLAKQDALDSGYDDCLFLDASGEVCELSAANIFLVRNGTLITPGVSSDVLEGINRRTILELAAELRIPSEERRVDLTELYVADEAFACGTSAFISPIKEIDARTLPKSPGPLTQALSARYRSILEGADPLSTKYLSAV